MKITIGTPEILIICGTILGISGNATGLVVLSFMGCASAVFRFASNHQESIQKE